jgi:hypothetical protein
MQMISIHHFLAIVIALRIHLTLAQPVDLILATQVGFSWEHRLEVQDIAKFKLLVLLDHHSSIHIKFVPV